MKLTELPLRWLRGASIFALAVVALCLAGPAAAQSHPALSGGKYPVKIESAPPGATI